MTRILSSLLYLFTQQLLTKCHLWPQDYAGHCELSAEQNSSLSFVDYTSGENNHECLFVCNYKVRSLLCGKEYSSMRTHNKRIREYDLVLGFRRGFPKEVLRRRGLGPCFQSAVHRPTALVPAGSFSEMENLRLKPGPTDLESASV